MSTKRALSLSPRKEKQRDAHPIEPPLQFSLNEIKQHFTDSLDSVKAQYDVADALLEEGNPARNLIRRVGGHGALTS